MGVIIDDHGKKPASSRVTRSDWADGLRGIASVFVVTSHMTLCFARYIVPPAWSDDGPSALFQRPFFRLVGQGQAWVAVFFVLLGYVNSLKAVRLARAGSTDQALKSLSQSAFRRTGRLVLPATVVTIITWFFCQLGAFELATKTDAFWIKSTSPRPSSSWFVALEDLAKQLISTWVRGENAYDQPQWALLSLFKGSLYVFMTLLATVNTTSEFRLCTEIVLYMWSWAASDSTVGINVFAGMILAELSFIPVPSQRLTINRILPYFFAITGLYLCSFPNEYYHQKAWSRQLWYIGWKIFPPGANLGRFYAGVGAQILCFSILFSPSMRVLLSNRYLQWLGGISYPLYLLHGPLMRSVMTYMLFWPASWTFQPKLLSDGTPDQGSLIPVPDFWVLCVLLPIFAFILLLFVNLWALKVEPHLGAAADRFENFARTWKPKDMVEPAQENGTLLPLVHPKR